MICDKDNIGSAKSIIKNGEVLENEFINLNGKTMKGIGYIIEMKVLNYDNR